MHDPLESVAHGEVVGSIDDVLVILAVALRLDALLEHGELGLGLGVPVWDDLAGDIVQRLLQEVKDVVADQVVFEHSCENLGSDLLQGLAVALPDFDLAVLVFGHLRVSFPASVLACLSGL